MSEKKKKRLSQGRSSRDRPHDDLHFSSSMGATTSATFEVVIIILLYLVISVCYMEEITDLTSQTSPREFQKPKFQKRMSLGRIGRHDIDSSERQQGDVLKPGT